MIRVVFSGAAGRMGQALLPGIRQAEGIEVVGEVEKDDDLEHVAREASADVVVDFTVPSAAVRNARAMLCAGVQGVIGTTGFEPSDLDQLDEEARAAGVGLLVAPNFALGMILLQRFAVEAARHFENVEIIEAHHPQKVDAPSGTAYATARRIAEAGAIAQTSVSQPSRGLDVDGVRVHSLRLPGIVARQEVVFGGLGERLVLEHEATSRACFLSGVLLGLRRIQGHRGVLRSLDPLLEEDG